MWSFSNGSKGFEYTSEQPSSHIIFSADAPKDNNFKTEQLKLTQTKPKVNKGKCFIFKTELCLE